MKRLILLLATLCVLINPAFAADTGWSTVYQLFSGSNSTPQKLVIKGGAFSTTCTNTTEAVLTDNQVQYDLIKKSLYVAFVTGKQVKGVYTNCLDNRAELTQLYICRDETSCGQ